MTHALKPPHGPLVQPRHCNYAILREFIEHTHTWRQKKNRGTLQLFSHMNCYFMDMDEAENIRFGLKWQTSDWVQDPVTQQWARVSDSLRTEERILWTLDANNVYTLQPSVKDIRCNHSYIYAMRRASPFGISNCTIHGVHQVKLWTRRFRDSVRYVPGIRVTRTGDVLGGVPFAAPRLDKAAAKSYRFLGQWFKDAKAMAQFDTRTRTEHAQTLANDQLALHWTLYEVAKRIVDDPTDNFELFYLVLMSRRWLGHFYQRPDAHVSINDQLISPYRSLRERILQQAGVYILPYEV